MSFGFIGDSEKDNIRRAREIGEGFRIDNEMREERLFYKYGRWFSR